MAFLRQQSKKNLFMLVLLTSCFGLSLSALGTSVDNEVGGFSIISAKSYQTATDNIVAGYKFYITIMLFEVDLFLKFLFPILAFLVVLVLLGVIEVKKNNGKNQKETPYIKDDKSDDSENLI